MLERREALQPVISFQQAIRDASFRPGRVYEGPDVIDLGPNQPQIEELIDYTNSHPYRHEAGRVYYVERDGKVMTGLRFFTGSVFKIGFKFNLGENGDFAYYPYAPKLVRQQRLIGSLVHTHSGDSVYTLPMDLELILLSDDVSKAAASIFLITPRRQILTFRGRKTPQLSMQYLDSQKKVGNLQVGVPDVMDTIAISDQDIQRLDSDDKDIFRKFVKAFDLQVFEGGVNDRFLRRMHPDQIAR